MLVGLLVGGMAILLLLALLSKPAGSDWLSVSQPAFRSRTNADGTTPTLSFSVSNAGPRKLEFLVSWLECRARADLTLLATNRGSLVPLASGARTKLVIDLPRSPVPGGEYLFCCELNWQASDPWLWRVGERLEPRVSQAMALFDTQWVPPWVSRSRPLPQGQVFLSSVRVADYFSLVYGLTRSKWLENIARAQAATTQSNGEIKRLGRMPTAEERLALEAEMAFALFCRQTVNGSEHAEPNAAPTAGPAKPSGDSEATGGRHR